MLKQLLTIFISLTFLTGCTSTDKLEALELENQKLELEIEQIRNEQASAQESERLALRERCAPYLANVKDIAIDANLIRESNDIKKQLAYYSPVIKSCAVSFVVMSGMGQQIWVLDVFTGESWMYGMVYDNFDLYEMAKDSERETLHNEYESKLFQLYEDLYEYKKDVDNMLQS